ncbi:MAG: hypothetical protein H0W08_21585 [Acidobacteria bacterium]|nr:hypothetical protein [Acidobacteriota bacterium]
MNLAHLKSDNLVGMEIDAIAADAPEQEAALRPIEAVFLTARDTSAQTAKDPARTPLGQRQEIQKALKQAAAELRPFAATAERLGAAAGATRAQALQPPAGERTVEVLMIEREIRDRLASKDALEVNAIYQSALSQGDLTTCSAIERAPASFALLTPEMREQGEAVKLAHSPLADQLAAQELAHRRYAGIVATTRTQLAALAAHSGVDLPDA